MLETANYKLAGDAPVMRAAEPDRPVGIWAGESEQGQRGKLLFGVSIVKRECDGPHWRHWGRGAYNSSSPAGSR